MTDKTVSLLETTLNTRDLGGYRAADARVTRELSLLRSDEIKQPSERDVRFLRESGVTTIIDLRTDKDTAASPSPFAATPGFRYLNAPIEEGSGIPATVEDVPHSYMRIAQAKRMPEVFRCMAYAEGGVLYHCSAGKDRTGVVSAILLMLAGVADSDIVCDYMLTEVCNEKRFALLKQSFPEIDVNIVIPRETFMEDFLALFRAKYGTAEDYLRSACGLDAHEIARLRAKLRGA